MIKDPSFSWENRIGMWNPQAQTGFVNKPDFSGYAHGIIPVRTDSLGFRWNGSDIRMARDTRKRIVYMGDSIVWGVGIQDQKDTIPGAVSRFLGDDFEIINAGVIGYSSLQEWFYLSTVIAELDPDEVVINWCYNDFLPTEDPFGNIRKIHIEYFNDLRNKGMKEPENEIMERLIGVFENEDQRVWDQVNYSTDRQMKELCLRTCVDLPISRMADFCRTHGIKLTWLMVPSFEFSTDHQFFYHYFMNLLRENGIEFVDAVPVINSLNNKKASTYWKESSSSGNAPLPAFFLRDYSAFIRVRSFYKTHHTEIFFDPHHLTVKGSRIVAKMLAEHHINS